MTNVRKLSATTGSLEATLTKRRSSDEKDKKSKRPKLGISKPNKKRYTSKSGIRTRNVNGNSISHNLVPSMPGDLGVEGENQLFVPEVEHDDHDDLGHLSHLSNDEEEYYSQADEVSGQSDPVSGTNGELDEDTEPVIGDTRRKKPVILILDSSEEEVVSSGDENEPSRWSKDPWGRAGMKKAKNTRKSKPASMAGSCDNVQAQTEIVETASNAQVAENKSLSSYNCPICFDGPDKSIALPCGHMYCFDCLFQAFGHSRVNKKTQAACALCRASYNLRQTVVLKFKLRQ